MATSFAHEDHLRLLNCIERVGSARNTLKLIESRGSADTLVGPAFCYAVVEYVVPFTAAHGMDKRHLPLTEDNVPEAFLPLHRRLVSLRHELLAHGDLRLLQPVLHVDYVGSEKYVSHVQNIVRGTDELRNLGQIITLTEMVLDSLYSLERYRSSEIEP